MIIFKLVLFDINFPDKKYMREFRKTPRKSKLRVVLEFLFPMFFGHHDVEIMNFRGHNNRMESRRRKTLFDRCRKYLLGLVKTAIF